MAAVLRRELDILLSDYESDYALIATNEFSNATEEQIRQAGERVRVLDWLRSLWSADARASEERLEGLAQAVITYLEERSRGGT